jgi:hypothetical protein
MRHFILALVAAVILVPATDVFAGWDPDKDLANIDRWHTKKMQKEDAKFLRKAGGLQEEIDILLALGDLDGAAELQAELDKEQAKYYKKMATIERQLTKKMEQHNKRVQKQLDREARKAAKEAEKAAKKAAEEDPEPEPES